MENLKLYFNDAELASALIYAKKKKTRERGVVGFY